MKNKLLIIKSYFPWLFLVFAMDAFSALLLWIADARAFRAMVLLITIASILLFFSVCLVILHCEEKKRNAFFAFLDNPDEYNEKMMLKSVGDAGVDCVYVLGETLRDKMKEYEKLAAQVSDYEEYVESWVHEVKTPLSLLTLLLDNRRDQLPGHTVFKLEYIRNRMQEYIDQMLYYARIKGERKDYLFEYIALRPFLQEVLENYRPLLEEKQFLITMEIADEEVYTDCRGLRFLLGQIISNAIKYSTEEPELYLKYITEEGKNILSIQDNGVGVRECDFPYIFEKGFTGDSHEGRKHATGMGLYLAKELADDLMLSLQAKSQWQKGFEMQILFPLLESDS